MKLEVDERWSGWQDQNVSQSRDWGGMKQTMKERAVQIRTEKMPELSGLWLPNGRVLL
jgi:hypothetical protein